MNQRTCETVSKDLYELLEADLQIATFLYKYMMQSIGEDFPHSFDPVDVKIASIFIKNDQVILVREFSSTGLSFIGQIRGNRTENKA